MEYLTQVADVVAFLIGVGLGVAGSILFIAVSMAVGFKIMNWIDRY